MDLEFVALLSGSGLFVSVLAFFIMWRRPADVPDMYLRRLAAIEAELGATRRELDATRADQAATRGELEQTRRDLAVTRHDLAEMTKRYAATYEENLRFRLIITWLRKELIEHGVAIPPLPEELQDPHLAPPPGNLNVRIQQGGVSASDQANLSAGGDVIGRDKTEGR